MSLAELLLETKAASRRLARQPAAVFVRIVLIALTTAVTATALSVVDVSWRLALPIRDAGALVAIRHQPAGGTDVPLRARGSALAAWRTDPPMAVSATYLTREWTVGYHGAVHVVTGATVSPRFFDAVQPLLFAGRLPASLATGDSDEVLISYGLWRRLGGTPGVVGDSLTANWRSSLRIAGVAARGLEFPDGADLWWSTSADVPGRTVGRLLGHRSPDAPASLTVVGPHAPEGRSRLVSVVDAERASVPLVVSTIVAIAGAVFVVAFCNLGAIELLDAVAARPGRATRHALGTRGLAMTISTAAAGLALATAGVALGLLAAHLLVSELRSSTAPALAFTQMMALSPWTVFATVAGVGTAACGAIAVPWPLARASGAMGPARQQGTLRAFGRRALLATQVAAMITAVGLTTVWLSALWRRTQEPLGLDLGGRLQAQVRLDTTAFGRPPWPEVAAAYARIEARVRTEPGLAAAALKVGPGPVDRDQTIVSLQRDAATASVEAVLHPVSAGYFDAIGLSLRGGRVFLPDDYLPVPDGGYVAVVSDRLASRLYGRVDVVGEHVRSDFGRHEIVGVVASTASLGPVSERPGEIYVPHVAAPGFVLTVVASGDSVSPQQLAAAIQSADKRAHVVSSGSVAEAARDTFADVWMGAVVASVLGGVTALAAGAGLWAFVVQTVRARRDDLMIRAAVGASPARLVAALGHEIGWSIGGGIGGGAIGLLAASRLLAMSDGDGTARVWMLAALLAAASVVLATAALCVQLVRRTGAGAFELLKLR